MKLTDMLISAALKKGILLEAPNFDAVFEIPTQTQDPSETITIKVKADKLTIRIDKGE